MNHEAKECMEDLLKSHLSEWKSLCGHLAKYDPVGADELWSESALRVLEWLEDGNRPLRPRSFLRKVVSNLARDRYRRSKRMVPMGPEAVPWDCFEGPSGHSDGPEQRLIAREALAHLRRLPRAQQTALLHRGMGESYEHIASELATTCDNARRLVCEGRARARSPAVA